ncbi:Mur ligase family protein [Paraconexibacter algicola]|uniref:UDP-N-acetylmuramoylalanine--D-glutamate ligase n=1 Tax=Paraconexibacter algicola TaxID=2133960 RepID=A0A2T4UD88_9ACTN|nr:UDP-N-acetylmuramoyl-L-alanine--D-glutamate ligase [Paraconexibacter algicola]PTL55470.1 UDP-N-acetylmuramoyl-L-alanine--D-glutamate ligase [Paraconexibacter algicola]
MLPPGPYLVVGLARSGLAAGRALVAAGHAVVGVDSGRPELPADPGFPVHDGSDGLALLDAHGIGAVVKSPGVPPHAPVVAAARERGIPVLGELELGWRLVPLDVVAVTGTNGKTTVSEWLGHAHRVAGRPVHVVGNVGTAYTSLIDAHEPGATVIAECSSYQLHDTLAFRPDVGILLNLGSDHLNWHGTVDAYRDAKRHGMFARQHAADTAIAPGALLPLPGDGAAIDLDLVELPAEPALQGAHNRVNARAVTAACRARGIPEEAIAQALVTFAGVEHRLQELPPVGGVRFVNDSKATNVESALTALAAFDVPLHLILGGDDAKQEDFGPLRAPVAAKAASVQLVGAAAGRLRDALGRGEDRGDLERAVAAAAALARPGEVVLLSPACASFGQYRDFEERGRHFAALVAARHP